MRKVGREQRHRGSAQCAVISQIEDCPVEGEQGDDDQKQRGIAEFQRKTIGEDELAVSGHVSVMQGQIQQKYGCQAIAQSSESRRKTPLEGCEDGCKKRDCAKYDEVYRTEKMEGNWHVSDWMSKLSIIGHGQRQGCNLYSAY